MSADRKKLRWISISACVFVLIVLAAGFVLLTPKKNGALAPATIGNSAAPKAQDPQDFLSAPPPAPVPLPTAALTPPHNQDGGMIIVYGDKPSITSTTNVPPTTEATTSTPTATPATKVAPTPTVVVPAKAPATKKPVLKPVSVKVDEYWIQAASFSSRGRADELKQGLSEKGVAAIITVKDISGKSWYRVRIGPYSVKADADGWLGRLKAIPGCSEAYVSRMIATKTKP